jgi:S-adenosylmethionine hydrolase
MPIITLTSDLGNKDPYIASVKGYIYRHIPNAIVVDISHSIATFNIAEASYIVKNAYKEFPSDTIHIIGIDASYEPMNLIGVKTRDGIFFAHDNGVVSLILESELPLAVVYLPFSEEHGIFPFKSVLAAAAVKLALGTPFEQLGEIKNDYYQLANVYPPQDEFMLKGTVIHVDVFGNVVTNIHKSLYDRVVKGRNVRVYVTAREYISKISTNYTMRKEDSGSLMCLFNNNDLLEVAMHRGSVSNLLGIKLGAVITIVFE